MYKDKGVTKVVGLESRGFIFAPILANKLHAVVSISQHINLFNKAILSLVGGIAVFFSLLMWLFMTVSRETMGTYSTLVANIILFGIIIIFISWGMWKKTMLICQLCHLPTPWGTLNETFFNEERLIDFLDSS